MKPIWRYTLISVFSALVLGYIVFSLWLFSGYENEIVCRTVNIDLLDKSEIQLITEKDIALMLEGCQLNPMGRTLKYIKTEAIEKELHRNPMIKMVECYKTPSGIINILIRQRIPKFRVVGWGSYYVDIDRKTMPVSVNYAAYIPIVSGKVTVSMATGPIFDFVNFLSQDPFWNAQIEQIYVREDKKIELVPRVGDAIILLGTLDNYPSKLEKLKKIYVDGFNLIGWNRYKTIDLQYKDQVVCSKDELTEIAASMQKDTVRVEKKDSVMARKL